MPFPFSFWLEKATTEHLCSHSHPPNVEVWSTKMFYFVFREDTHPNLFFLRMIKRVHFSAKMIRSITWGGNSFTHRKTPEMSGHGSQYYRLKGRKLPPDTPKSVNTNTDLAFKISIQTVGLWGKAIGVAVGPIRAGNSWKSHCREEAPHHYPRNEDLLRHLRSTELPSGWMVCSRLMALPAVTMLGEWAFSDTSESFLLLFVAPLQQNHKLTRSPSCTFVGSKSGVSRPLKFKVPVSHSTSAEKNQELLLTLPTFLSIS